MRKFFFNPQDCGFYLEGVHSEIPSTAKEIPLAVYRELSGKQVVADEHGNPSEFVSPPISVNVLLEGVKSALRKPRAEMLDALSGIAGRAARAGNTALAAEADALAQALLDITDDPALNAAPTLEDMQAAAVAAYRAIAAGASAELASVFKEITGP